MEPPRIRRRRRRLPAGGSNGDDSVGGFQQCFLVILLVPFLFPWIVRLDFVYIYFIFVLSVHVGTQTICISRKSDVLVWTKN